MYIYSYMQGVSRLCIAAVALYRNVILSLGLPFRCKLAASCIVRPTYSAGCASLLVTPSVASSKYLTTVLSRTSIAAGAGGGQQLPVCQKLKCLSSTSLSSFRSVAKLLNLGPALSGWTTRIISDHASLTSFLLSPTINIITMNS